MSDYLDKSICSIHQMETVVVDLNPSPTNEEQQLCIKCLALSSSRSLILNTKNKEYQQQQKLFECKLENYHQLCQKLQEYSDWLNGFMSKILAQINNQIEKIKKCFSSLSEPEDQIQKEDLMLLTQSLNEDKQFQSTNILEDSQEDESEFILSIKDQLSKLQFDDAYKDIVMQVQKLQNSRQQKEKAQTQILKTEKSTCPQKTPSLKFNCNKHGKEIIIFTLDQNCQEERLLCVDCIPNSVYKLITLDEVEKVWMIHQGKVYDSYNTFLSQRKQKQQQILEIIENYQESQKLTLEEIMQSVQKQNELLVHQIFQLEENKDKKSILELELNEIKQSLNILAQKDQMQQDKLNQLKQINDDQQHYEEIFKKFDDLDNLEKTCKSQIFYLLYQNELSNQRNKLDSSTQVVKMFETQNNQITGIFCPVSSDTKLLKFSTCLKHSSITISMDGKTAQSTSEAYQLCLCDVPIQKQQPTEISFKVKQINSIMAGVCLQNQYKQDFIDSFGFDKGCYFLQSWSTGCNVYSHHDKTKQGASEGFPFQQNDVISIEVNIFQKLITWRNITQNQVYAMEIETTENLYFCFTLYCNNEIELV